LKQPTRSLNGEGGNAGPDIGEDRAVLPGFLSTACNWRISCEQGRSGEFKRSL